MKENFEILLDKIKLINNEGWIESLRTGDTGVGYTLETKLGIKANSQKKPDFKGIEIKSFRKRTTGALVTLFSQVPNWKKSNSNRNEILEKYGYLDENERYSLYCSVYANNKNNLGWQLQSDENKKKIYIKHNNINVTFWDFEKIENRITKKHKETFFIFADTKKEEGKEYFLYNKIIHAKNSSLEKFLILLKNGKICHDFVMHRKKSGATRDHGFLWRIKNISIPELFEYNKEIILN
jgi:hypothetical protein|tara:strand:+ start:243 stop:956 length:714 start_codon:yes stop_codon:yes gene_type:complete